MWRIAPSWETKPGTTRLGFAVLLKFFRREGRFPQHKHEVPGIVITFLATQVGVDATAYMQYSWQGRTIVNACAFLYDRSIRNLENGRLERYLRALCFSF